MVKTLGEISFTALAGDFHILLGLIIYIYIHKLMLMIRKFRTWRCIHSYCKPGWAYDMHCVTVYRTL